MAWKPIRDEFVNETAGDGRPLYGHRYDEGYCSLHLTLDGEGLDVAYSDCDGDHCNMSVGVGVIVELLRRAGYTVIAPSPKGGEGESR